MSAIAAFAEFVVSADVPARAREAAGDAVLDTVGVMLAGAVDPVGRSVQAVARAEGGNERCQVVGVALRSGAAWAALANGTAAHALDFDDMCWVTLAHPSAPLVAAGLAAAELAGATGRELLDAYSVGYEVEAALGRAMNPAHYAHGWHSTSTIGTIGAAAAAARLLVGDGRAAGRALSIAASSASGLKANFGTMVKPLQAGLAARNGLVAALLAAEGFTASEAALDHPQGFLAAMQSERPLVTDAAELGRRWEILEGGITVKLYPSCAATHPTIDTLIDLRRQHGFAPDEVASVEIGVDPIVPTVLIYDDPRTGLEAKFSLPYCAAAAIGHGAVDIDTFEPPRFGDAALRRLVPRVTMRVDADLADGAPPLTQARVTVRLRDGRVLERVARGARGYPDRPATAADRDRKFLSCASRAVSREAAAQSLAALRGLASASHLRDLMTLLGQASPLTV